MRKSEGREDTKQGKGFPYNDNLARWWRQRSIDGSHGRAYRNIADFIQASYPRPPSVIVDYACGAGNLLSLLSYRFPNTRLMGLDGSSFLLGLALRRLSRLPRSCSRRISLIKTTLPRPKFLCGRADLVIFCFPNMIPFSKEEHAQKGKFGPNRGDREIARCLAPENSAALEWSRRISFNLRRLLVPGGICVRVEYATMNRHELSADDLMQISFEEGSLDVEVEGRMPRQWFRVMASAYFRSRVLEDVYEQTADEQDRNGGYLITVLRATDS
jgi:hypothetical protein